MPPSFWPYPPSTTLLQASTARSMASLSLHSSTFISQSPYLRIVPYSTPVISTLSVSSTPLKPPPPPPLLRSTLPFLFISGSSTFAAERQTLRFSPTLPLIPPTPLNRPVPTASSAVLLPPPTPPTDPSSHSRYLLFVFLLSPYMSRLSVISTTFLRNPACPTYPFGPIQFSSVRSTTPVLHRLTTKPVLPLLIRCSFNSTRAPLNLMALSPVAIASATRLLSAISAATPLRRPTAFSFHAPALPTSATRHWQRSFVTRPRCLMQQKPHSLET